MAVTFAGYAGGLYVARTYLRDRLDLLKQKMDAENIARDNLRRRFQQTQEDVSYTVLALLPTLSEQILQTMDLELLTNELQSRSRSRNKPPPPSPTEGDGYSSLSSSVDIVNPHSPSATATSSLLESSEENGDKERAAISAGDETESSVSSTASSGETRSKTELWHEVKIMTFTRTLTTLYSITLLCLFSTLQLTLLARSKYLASLIEQERDERVREQLEAGLTTSNLVFGSLGLGPAASSRLESLLSGGPADDNDELGSEQLFQRDLGKSEGISEDAESKYLTLSWWLLHVGWKDVSERVRRAVEETFDGVSLKTKIAIMDLHQLIYDVRRRVEHEITFEGTEKRTDFLSSLLPPTPETIYHVLTQGGYAPAHHSYTETRTTTTTTKAAGSSPTSSQLSHDFANPPHPHRSSILTSATPPPHIRLSEEPFATLLHETRSALSSPDFARVLEVCLDHATEILFDSLEKNIFRPSHHHQHHHQEEGEGKGKGEGEEEVRMRLAALLPGLAKWSQLALNGLPNELIDKSLTLREVSCFSAISFARFEEQLM